MSKTYRVTVDGTSYVVEVEDLGGTTVSAAAPVATPAPSPVAPAPTPAQVPVAAAPAPAPAPAPVGGTVVAAPMPGKILKVNVATGASVQAGDVLLILEAMKMENEIISSSAGTVQEIRAREGDNVNTGDTLVILG
ncbi:biotin/lipoyl-containing protein [Aminobacterium sp. UBA4834]|uniref:biotin/lipoyl-containing protein n=1 Tax=Aminobacterium sp. UBA4834 TaxID=1946022 RepID=UPI00257E8B54|nr:biotin/lipoyl-containing protein [Aminobacterium sp. UBA4834]